MHSTMAVGIVAMVLLAAGAMLYAINSPQVALTRTILASGAALLVAYIGLNLRTITAFYQRRSSRYGANMAVMIVLFACIVVIVQALSVRHSYRLDVTRNQRFSLADQTMKVQLVATG